MAREDIIPQLLRQLMLKEGPPEQSDNTILQKMIAPLDKATLSDNLTVNRVPTSDQIWGNFSWSMSQWGAVQEKMLAPQDQATLTDSINVVKLRGASQVWGGGNWSMNQWKDYNLDHTWGSNQNNTWSSLGNTPWDIL
jgi:hypothetical protein